MMNKMMRVCQLLLGTALVGLAIASAAHAQQDNEKLNIGITLHPYYSFVTNIVGDRANVIPLISAEANPHGYTPQAADMKRILDMDVMVVNGIGHDSWAFEILEAVGGKESVPLIYANDGVSLIPIAGSVTNEKVVNPHTFISTIAAIQQVYGIARRLGEIDPDNADFYRSNSRQYALSLRKLRAEFEGMIEGAELAGFRCATMHSGYDYILQELGLTVSAVIEPRHGVEPTARQMADTIDRIKAADVTVLFAEKYFASKLSDTIREATGVEMFSISHISSGPYTADKFEQEMRDNLTTLASAIRASQST